MSHDAHDEGGHDEHEDHAEGGHDAHESHDDHAVDNNISMFRRAYDYVFTPWKTRLAGAAAFAVAPPFGIMSPFIGAFAAPYVVKKGNDWWDWLRNTYSIGGTPAAAHH